jgi:hypothetical protein
MVLKGKPALLRHVSSECPERKIECKVCRKVMCAKELRLHRREHQMQDGHWCFATTVRIPKPLVYGAEEDCVLVHSYEREDDLATVHLECLHCDDEGGVAVTVGTGFNGTDGMDYASEVRAHLCRGQETMLRLFLAEPPPATASVWLSVKLQRKRARDPPTRQREPDIEIDLVCGIDGYA